MALWNKQEQVPAVGAGPMLDRTPEAPPLRRDEPSAPRREEPLAGQAGDLLLGPGAEFDGKLTFRGTLRLDAKFTGSIVTNDVLIVGEHARMNAEISCGTVIVHGEIDGNVRASALVELRPTAKVRGDILAPSLVIERGAFLQGTVRLGDKVQRPDKRDGT
jgi:cytoskeletal protein CcmA (bactofilin family)